MTFEYHNYADILNKSFIHAMNVYLRKLDAPVMNDVSDYEFKPKFNYGGTKSFPRSKAREVKKFSVLAV